MNKGICFHFGFVYDDLKEQVKDIKNMGFDCVMTNPDPAMNKENGSIKKQVKLFGKYGIQLSSLHMRYRRVELPHFFMDDKIGKKLEKNLIKDVKIAHKYGFTCVVVHVEGKTNVIGLERLKRVLKLCEKLNIPLALENLSNNSKCLEFMFKNINSDYLKFCWDVGHNNVFTPEIDFATIYKDKLITLHLHDNLGANVTDEEFEKLGYKNIYINGESRKYNPDMHTLNKYGNIDWEDIAKKLAKIKYPLNLDYEVMMVYRKNETSQETLKQVFSQACELEKMIMKHKTKTIK